jgi:hypothetical protein
MQELLMPRGQDFLTSFLKAYTTWHLRDLVGYFWAMLILKNNTPSGWKTVFQSREWNASRRPQEN